MLNQKFNLYKSEWLDLVFENRNKNYGAYELRNSYSVTMARAMAITVFGFVAGALTLSIVTRHRDLPTAPIERVVKVDLTRVLPPPPQNKPNKPLQQHTTLPQSHPSTVVIPTQVTERETPVEPPTLTEISKATVGAEASKGTGTEMNTPLESQGTGNSNGASNTGKDSDAPLQFADVAPEPNGGMTGWSKFLQRNLHYPETETQGRVIVSFIVERDGSLSDIKIIRSISPELDREALRVLKMAPKWKPGMQSGQAVRVQYNIPINFQLNN